MESRCAMTIAFWLLFFDNCFLVIALCNLFFVNFFLLIASCSFHLHVETLKFVTIFP